MKVVEDIRRLGGLAKQQQGVFSSADLRAILADRHPAAFARRVDRLMEARALRRFLRGWYVAEDFDLATLSQRLAPESYVSFANVLARELLIGPRPERQVMAVRVGRARRYRAAGFEIVHLGISPDLFFGFGTTDGIQSADSEKAVLDVLYFHLRGQRYVFDPFSDIDFSRLDRTRLERYLSRYRNPRFVSFASKLLELA
jgi:hypothetical protein